MVAEISRRKNREKFIVAEFQEKKCIVADFFKCYYCWTLMLLNFKKKKCIVTDVLNVVTAGLSFYL